MPVVVPCGGSSDGSTSRRSDGWSSGCTGGCSKGSTDGCSTGVLMAVVKVVTWLIL